MIPDDKTAPANSSTPSTQVEPPKIISPHAVRCATFSGGPAAILPSKSTRRRL